MKILPKHYEVLKAVINAQVEHNPGMFYEYQERGLSDQQYRWDLLYQSGVIIGDGTRMPGDIDLYSYLDVRHVDAALKKIVSDHV